MSLPLSAVYRVRRTEPNERLWLMLTGMLLAPFFLTVSAWKSLPTDWRIAAAAVSTACLMILLRLAADLISWKRVYEITADKVTFSEGNWRHRDGSERPLSDFKGLSPASTEIRRWWGGKQTVYQIFLEHASEPMGHVLVYCGKSEKDFRDRLDAYPRLLGKPLLEKRGVMGW